MRNGLPLGLLDFLLVTTMLLVTPSEEWMKLTPIWNLRSISPPAHFRGHSGGRSMAWSTPARAKDDNRSRYAESIDGPASEASSQATSRLSSYIDDLSAVVQHVAYASGQGVYAMHSGSSLSLASHALSSRHPNRRTHELPPLPSSQGYSYTCGPPLTSSQVSQMSLTRRTTTTLRHCLSPRLLPYGTNTLL
ncbi:hypothetical protein BJY52DRAFT_449867 [Lactarius psammicola]|nr:hypothetical protein BJY52DRAFT_449867 [Lactarius psammicola]